MKTLFDAGVREELIVRLGKLRADSPARWGKFTAPKMVAHVNDCMRMATGELAVRPKGSALFATAPVRWLAIHVLPFPKAAPTAPELLQRTAAADLDAERAKFGSELDKVLARFGKGSWVAHPAFGPMTERDWGVLGYKHTDHHFRQFGI